MPRPGHRPCFSLQLTAPSLSSQLFSQVPPIPVKLPRHRPLCLPCRHVLCPSVYLVLCSELFNAVPLTLHPGQGCATRQHPAKGLMWCRWVTSESLLNEHSPPFFLERVPFPWGLGTTGFSLLAFFWGHSTSMAGCWAMFSSDPGCPEPFSDCCPGAPLSKHLAPCSLKFAFLMTQIPLFLIPQRGPLCTHFSLAS